MSPQSLQGDSTDEEKQGVQQEVREPNTAIEAIRSDPETSSDPEKGVDATASPAHTSDEDHEFISGIKLILVMAGVTLACFLMLLDTSIITTVSSC